jgi:hypothetical protein
MKSLQIAILLSMITTGASAQITLSSPGPGRYEPDQVIRITSNFRTTMALVGGHPDAKSQETARAEIYRLAAAECTLLAEIYKADCRLTGVNINNFLGINQMASPELMFANATYEVRRRSNLDR